MTDTWLLGAAQLGMRVGSWFFSEEPLHGLLGFPRGSWVPRTSVPEIGTGSLLPYSIGPATKGSKFEGKECLCQTCVLMEGVAKNLGVMLSN